MTPVCHGEERSDVAIHLNSRRAPPFNALLDHTEIGLWTTTSPNRTAQLRPLRAIQLKQSLAKNHASMQQRILQEFFEEDGRDLGQHRLLEFLREVPAKAKRQLNFNRFDLLIDRENEVVLIEDVLDASPVGACRVPLSEFITAVEAMSQNA